MSENEKQSPTILSTIIKIKLLRKMLHSRWFYLGLFFFILMVLGVSTYQHNIYIPADAKAFRIDNFSLGEEGTKPFYQTDADLKLTKKLISVKNKVVFKFLANRYYSLYKNKYSAGKLSTQYVQVSKDQFPQIYQMAEYVNDIIQLKKIPRIYISGSNGTRMVVTNYQNPVIIISSDFTWAFKQDELMFLLARAFVHIKCHHVFFLDLLKGVQAILNASLPDFMNEFIVGSMGIEFMDWYKEAETTADRGALVAIGDINVALKALIKLNIGSNIEDLYGDPNPEAYIRQLKGIKNDKVTTASAAMHELQNPNPFLTIRVRDLKKWYGMNSQYFK